MNLTVKDIIEICNGSLYSGAEFLICENFSKDTRTIQKGDIYIGIKGDNHDGNLYYKQAFQNGAKACILDKTVISKLEEKDKTIILVENTIDALKKLAIAKLKAHNPLVIAITGSVGKTSTRDMMYSVIKQKYKVLVTAENYNNNIGLPLTILKLKDEDILILEMGMNHLKEIDYLSKIANPDIAIITNVLPVHIELLKTMKNILKAKLEIVNGLKKDGKLIINNDNKYLAKVNLKNIKIITCGIENISMYQAINIKDKTFEVIINNELILFDNPIGTKPYVLNSLMVIAVALDLKIPIAKIQKGLKEYSLTSARLEKTESLKGVIIIDDTYNANPDSMINSIEYLLNETTKRKIAILGDMNELGHYAKEGHEKVGKFISTHNIDYLITIGNNAKYISDEAKDHMPNKNIVHFNTKEDAKNYIKKILKFGDTVLVKASNGHKFSEIVEYLKNEC